MLEIIIPTPFTRLLHAFRESLNSQYQPINQSRVQIIVKSKNSKMRNYEEKPKKKKKKIVISNQSLMLKLITY
jgi:hypothetical protein